ncbi:hypothetical protein HAX54_019812 [Datura stramonium]|uniref:Uncharacterized protein n=1 Tax=Datura stramonium TaxID=4076 RepID=A0ABS8UPU1_DATST|nr:hypothetical protein [Datura stramonium]
MSRIVTRTQGYDSLANRSSSGAVSSDSGGDNTLAKERVVLVASLMSGEARVPILAGIDIKKPTTMKYDLEMYMTRSFIDQLLRPSTSDAAIAQQGAELADTTSVMPQSSLYAFEPTNLAKMVLKEDRHEKQLKLFAEILDLVMFVGVEKPKMTFKL